MTARVHMSFKVTAFNANGSMSSVNSCKAYIQMSLLSETHLKAHDRLSAVTCLPVISCYSPALKMEAIRCSKTSVQTRATWCYIPEDDIFQSLWKPQILHRLYIVVYSAKWRISITYWCAARSGSDNSLPAQTLVGHPGVVPPRSGDLGCVNTKKQWLP
jgi:hypothetical protein